MKRPQSNSAAAAVKAMLDAAAKLPEPPAHVPLTPAALKYWPAIIGARTLDEWSEADLVIGARLAQTMADIADETTALQAEGTVLGLRMNPRFTVLDQLVKRELALMRSLRMCGRGAGDVRDEAGRRQTARKARKVLDSIGNDGLIA